ncbi:MAG: glycerol-3-phosphate acyltransferase, partial [Ruminococcus sp.]|nr:glycerol-3-phosphate acyltransferase [Ruminococcus sp.]
MWQLGAAFSGLFCMLGHCFPVWYRFKGGKAFMAGFATTWFVDWRMAVLAMMVFFVVLGMFKFMSVASCTAALACPIILFFLGPASGWVEILCAVSTLLVIVRHYPNYIKLKNGTESKFSLKSKKAA